MQALSSLIRLNKKGKQSLYLQIATQLSELIRSGTLQTAQRLPSSRQLAEHLQVNRRTVVQAYDELLAQGWLHSQTGNGTFVASHIPRFQPQLPEAGLLPEEKNRTHAGFSFKKASFLDRPVLKNNARYHLDDGFPDVRIAPLEELSRAYRSQLLTGNSYAKLGYGDTQGSYWLRKELSGYLNETRGLHTTIDNILIVRGTMMGLHLASTALIEPGNYIAIGESSWSGATINFQQAGAHFLKIPVDESGIQVDELEKHCQLHAIRLVYITSHHHYPTTVALRADRRVKLLQLAEEYGFIIFEDDYDYDFHYQSKPLLPLAGADQAGMVLYCGSFTKTISPAFRVGYLVGPADVITYLAKLRRIIDRQGDTILENAIAELLQNGIIQRHLRKSLRTYRQRRDLFCSLLKEKLGEYVEFEAPDGGMAVWTKFDKSINLIKVASQALSKDLYFSDGSFFNLPGTLNNATRLGFASSNPSELEYSVEVLEQLIKAQ